MTLQYLTREESVLEALEEAGERGLTVYELIHSSGGVDARKRISNLRRKGYTITDVWEQNGKQRFKRYFLKTEPNFIDDMAREATREFDAIMSKTFKREV